MSQGELGRLTTNRQTGRGEGGAAPRRGHLCRTTAAGNRERPPRLPKRPGGASALLDWGFLGRSTTIPAFRECAPAGSPSPRPPSGRSTYGANSCPRLLNQTCPGLSRTLLSLPPSPRRCQSPGMRTRTVRACIELLGIAITNMLGMCRNVRHSYN